MGIDITVKVVKMTPIYEGGLTHNLVNMAKAAGLYEYLWNTHSNNEIKASSLIEPLQEGIKKLISYPEYFKQFNPANTWGTYDDLLDLCYKLYIICKNNPNGIVSINK